MSITEGTLPGSTGLNRRTALIALIGAVSLAPSTVLAQTAAAPAAVVSSPMQFRTTVLMTGGFAMQTSQVALERSRNPLIREFAQLEINEQIALAAALGASPGSTPPCARTMLRCSSSFIR